MCHSRSDGKVEFYKEEIVILFTGLCKELIDYIPFFILSRTSQLYLYIGQLRVDVKELKQPKIIKYNVIP